MWQDGKDMPCIIAMHDAFSAPFRGLPKHVRMSRVPWLTENLCMQQALALFRTQHMVKLFLELSTTENRLVATVSADNGASMRYRPSAVVGQCKGRVQLPT